MTARWRLKTDGWQTTHIDREPAAPLCSATSTYSLRPYLTEYMSRERKIIAWRTTQIRGSPSTLALRALWSQIKMEGRLIKLETWYTFARLHVSHANTPQNDFSSRLSCLIIQQRRGLSCVEILTQCPISSFSENALKAMRSTSALRFSRRTEPEISSRELDLEYTCTIVNISSYWSADF